MRFSILPSVNVAIIEGERLLLSRRFNTGWMDGYLCLPGGHVEQGETPRESAVRELKEELGAKVSIDDLEFMCVAVRNTKPYSMLRMSSLQEIKSLSFLMLNLRNARNSYGPKSIPYPMML